MNRPQKPGETDYEYGLANLRYELSNAEDVDTAITKVYLCRNFLRPRGCTVSDADAAMVVLEKFPQYGQDEVEAAIRRFRETALAAGGVGLATALQDFVETFNFKSAR